MSNALKIILLTHEREYHRSTNTGSIALGLANGMVERVLWERTNPDPKLLELLENKEAALLYPTSESTNAGIADFETLVIIDSTWQEAQKIFNKSPYLKDAPKVSLAITTQSNFARRRNQVDGGFCTIECIIELCKLKKLDELADQLTIAFEQCNTNP
jgi:DTW domain-containing protein YfiP